MVDGMLSINMLLLSLLLLIACALNAVVAKAPPPRDVTSNGGSVNMPSDLASYLPKTYNNHSINFSNGSYDPLPSDLFRFKKDERAAKTYLLPSSASNATFLAPTLADIEYAKSRQEQRLAVKGAKAIFGGRKLGVIEYAVVQCSGCSKAAASEENAVCFVVYNQKRKNKMMPLRRDLFTKDGDAMIKARRDEKSACYIGDSPHVYGREEFKLIGSSEGDHTAVFVPLLRVLTPRFWSKTSVGRKIFRMLPPAEPLSPGELDMEGMKKTETDLVASPSLLLHAVRYNDKMSADQKALFTNANASQLFELISAGQSARMYASRPEISYMPISELSDAIRAIMPTDVALDDKEVLSTRATLLDINHHLATRDLQCNGIQVCAVCYTSSLAQARVALSSERARIAAYPKDASPLQEYCRNLYGTLQRAVLKMAHDFIDYKLQLVKQMLKMPPYVMVLLDVRELVIDSGLPAQSYWTDLCEPLNDLACRVDVSRLQTKEQLIRELSAQSRMYAMLAQNVALSLFPEASFVHSPTALPSKSALIAYDKTMSRSRELLANIRQQEISFFFTEEAPPVFKPKIHRLEKAVTEAFDTLKVPADFLPEARAYFEEWKSSVTRSTVNNLRTYKRDMILRISLQVVRILLTLLRGQAYYFP